jgi:hypothetical protein
MKHKSLDLKTTTALIIIIFLLGFGGTMLYYAFYKVSYMKIYDIQIEATEGNLIGFNADPTLHFGKIPISGGSAKKMLNTGNDVDFPLLVNIRIKGDAARFITVSDNNYILQPGESKKIDVYATIPINFSEVGVFTGEAKVIMFRQ